MAFISSVLSKLTDLRGNTSQHEQIHVYAQQPQVDEVVDDFIMVQEGDKDSSTSAGWGPPPPMYDEVMRSDDRSRSNTVGTFQMSRSDPVLRSRSMSHTSGVPRSSFSASKSDTTALTSEDHVPGDALKISPVDDIPFILSYYLTSALQLANLNSDVEMILLRSRYGYHGNEFDESDYKYSFNKEISLLREFGEKLSECEDRRYENPVESQQNFSYPTPVPDFSSENIAGSMNQREKVIVYPDSTTCSVSDCEGENTLYNEEIKYPSYSNDHVLSEMSDFGFQGQAKCRSNVEVLNPRLAAESDLLIDFS